MSCARPADIRTVTRLRVSSRANVGTLSPLLNATFRRYYSREAA